MAKMISGQNHHMTVHPTLENRNIDAKFRGCGLAHDVTCMSFGVACTAHKERINEQLSHALAATLLCRWRAWNAAQWGNRFCVGA
jgi:hypothetical protein